MCFITEMCEKQQTAERFPIFYAEGTYKLRKQAPLSL